MDRRTFLAALAAAAASKTAAAPGDAVPVVAVLAGSTAENFRGRAEALRRGLRARGHVEGKTLRLEFRYVGGKPERGDALAREIASLRPAVMVADSSAAVVRLRQAAPEIPVVMAAADDPAGSRFVRTLEKPETRVTGLSVGNPDAVLQAVDHLRALLPREAIVAALLNQNNATYRKIRARFRHQAMEGGLRPVMLDANLPGEIAGTLDTAFVKERAAGLVVMSDAMFYDERARIVKRVAASRRPAIYPDRAYVDAGGLMSYGAGIERNFEKSAAYVDRILKGASPGEMAVEVPSEYSLVINQRTARALGLKLPPELLRQAQLAG